MNKILIDAMHIYSLFNEQSKNGPYFEFSQALDDEKIAGVISVITLTELVKLIGESIYKEKINDLISSNVIIVDINKLIAIRAGEIRMKYGLPTADSLIAATCIVENVRHILTDDGHFDDFKNLKKINLKAALKMVK